MSRYGFTRNDVLTLAEAYRAPALPSPAPRGGFEARQEQCKKARAGLAVADKRLTLAEVVLKGGFPEEMLGPVREALGWGFSSLLALYGAYEPAPELPSSRLIQSELVENDHLPEDLTMRLARVRELTEPPTEKDTTPPPSIDMGEAMLAAVRSLLELGQQKVVEVGL